MITPPREGVTLASPLYVICDEDVCARAGWRLPDFAAACLAGGARLLQLRMKSGTSAAFLETAIDVVRRAREAGAQVIVNDRADIARLAGADGVHVGQHDLSPTDARRTVGDQAIVGLSTHTAEQVGRALLEPVSYIATGPVFQTRTKETGYSEVGLKRVRDTVSAARARLLPVVAIGGITIEHAPAVIAAGADSAAVISDLLATGDPAARVRQYLEVVRGVRLQADGKKSG